MPHRTAQVEPNEFTLSVVIVIVIAVCKCYSDTSIAIKTVGHIAKIRRLAARQTQIEATANKLLTPRNLRKIESPPRTAHLKTTR